MRFYDEEEGGESLVVAPEWGPVVPAAYERVLRMAQGNAVVVFSVSGCCMCHVVKRLLLGLGVGPTVYEIDQLQGGTERGEAAGREIRAVLSRLVVGPSSSSEHAQTAAAVGSGLPAVFVGGKLLGGVEKVMACHINGSLVPLLKQAGALWL